MAQIIKNCTSLEKYQQTVKNNPEDLKPTSCDICGCNHIWCNGLYKRSISGRDKERSKAEPVDILRFKCSKCKNHYSVLLLHSDSNHYSLGILNYVCKAIIMSSSDVI